MEKYIIEGGTRLVGEVAISGAKNAALAILAGTALAEEPCVIENVPAINDVASMIHILQSLGAQIKLISKNTYQIDCSRVITHEVPYELTRNMRAGYYFIGSLLGRLGKASVSMPGGCDLGLRPIDQHIKGFSALGVNIELENGMVQAETKKLLCSQIYFDVVSVGATANVMLAAVKADGITILENAAKEPHIVDLANFLNSMGADVRGAGTDTIKIYGVQKLHGCNYSIIPDQIEAGTYMVAAAASGGDVLVKNVIPKHLESIISRLKRVGAEVLEYDESIRVKAGSSLTKANVKSAPHPGFPTDMMPQFSVLLIQAQGISIVTESIFSNRFRYVDELRRMGANIQVDGNVAVIEGIDRLQGCPVKAPDLRAGAALMIAGIMGEGTTEIEEIGHIERGYEDVVEKFCSLGADIKKVVIPDTISVLQAQ